MRTRWAKTAFLSGLGGVTGGTLTVECPDRTYRYGEPGELDATLTVHDERFFLRALTGSDVGLGESFMDGDWTTPDLVPLVRLMLRNRRVLEGQNRFTGALRRLAGGVARRLRDNSLAGSRQHIRRHYDLGNEFFRLFLDAELLMYSCGYFDSTADSLEQAQARKVDRICRALRLSPTDHVLEIGSGWGVFEAVGLNHYDDYFSAVDRLLAPDGVMFLQTITVADQWFPRYHGTPDWIEKYIFPGGELASVGEMLKSLARTTALSLYHAENCGTHYAHTLQAWRARFSHNLARVRTLGFDDRFIRMWDLYLGSCEATFLERHTGLFQLLLVKNGAQRVLFNELWSEPATRPHAAGAGESAA